MPTKSKNMFSIPEEIHDIWCEYEALNILKESYVNQYFGFKKARKCAIDAERARTKFWRKVIELCPNKKSNKLSYNKEFMIVEILDANDKSRR